MSQQNQTHNLAKQLLSHIQTPSAELAYIMEAGEHDEQLVAEILRQLSFDYQYHTDFGGYTTHQARQGATQWNKNQLEQYIRTFELYLLPQMTEEDIEETEAEIIELTKISQGFSYNIDNYVIDCLNYSDGDCVLHFRIRNENNETIYHAVNADCKKSCKWVNIESYMNQHNHYY